MEELEEGQIPQHYSTPTEQEYDPAYEWPGENEYGQESTDDPRSNDSRPFLALRQGQPVFRLVVLRSSILSKRRKIAVIDAYPEVQFGRDVQTEGSTTPRIRLKEMQVSKLHATAFWDGARKEWSIVDMGSMHGTFLRAASVPSDSQEAGQRLSQSRTASIPRRLRHFDQLTIGGTTFQIHIHDDQRPCAVCTISGEEKIPLFPEMKSIAAKRTREVAGIDSGTSTATGVSNGRDPKKALTMLKRSLLNRHEEANPSSRDDSSKDYVDRAARRRFMHPTTARSDSPGISVLTPGIAAKSEAVSTKHSEPDSLSKPIVSQPPQPLPTTNIGHRLLMQQGWSPGSALGTPESEGDSKRLVEPLEVKASTNRAGLGIRPPRGGPSEASGGGLDWKEREKFRRFSEFGK
ncbi:hypothetical protein CPC08DRAFT_704768 [Agrocybe pediades]|nr:hypothetical protein CPC08DRAFT_704768 [Agrocybe pediades]